MADSHHQLWDTPADGDFARYVERLSGGVPQPGAQGAPSGRQPRPHAPHAPHQRSPDGPVVPGRPAEAPTLPHNASGPQALLSTMLAGVRRLLLSAGFVAVAISPLLGMRLWPLAFAAVALWLALGHVAARLDPARGKKPARTQRPGAIEALKTLTQAHNRHRQ